MRLAAGSGELMHSAEPASGVSVDELASATRAALARLSSSHPGLAVDRRDDRLVIVIPDALRTGHEAHFAEVLERYMDYATAGALPEWEVANMLAKYAITTKAVRLAGYE